MPHVTLLVQRLLGKFFEIIRGNIDLLNVVSNTNSCDSQNHLMKMLIHMFSVVVIVDICLLSQ